MFMPAGGRGGGDKAGVGVIGGGGVSVAVAPW